MQENTHSPDLFGAHLHNQVLIAGAAALTAAAQTGLLDAIVEGPGSAEELAASLDLHADAAERVLDMLEALGVVQRDGVGRYAAALLLRAEAEGPSSGPGHSLRLWGQITDYLRTGRCALEKLDTEVPRGPAYAGAVAGLGRVFRHISVEIADRLGPVPGAGRILDVGAGSGQWSLVMAAADPKVRVTSLDLEPVLPRFRERAAELDLGDRIATIAGDYHRVELEPASFDRIVAANVLHLEIESDGEALVRRLAPALAPGGQLVIIDALPGSREDLVQPRMAAYALSLGIRTGTGRPHPEPTLRRWLAAAGLDSCRRFETDDMSPMLFGALMAEHTGSGVQ